MGNKNRRVRNRDLSTTTMMSKEISDAVINMLRHLRTLPLDEIHDNIDIMILTLKGKPWDEICDEVYHSSQPKEISEIPNLEELGLSEEDVEEFGKLFLKNVDELAEIDE